jgi:diacylglycerol kinase family enzyme
VRTHPFLVVNPGSGGGKGLDKLLSAARALGIATARLGEPVDPEADVLGVAGGDGSLATVATVAIERDVPFVCIPFGTRNHFAHDAGLPTDPVAALSAFDGGERRVDAARVNGRVFLNNVSLGAYAGLVHGRVLAGLREPTFFVGNNRYAFHPFRLGARERLDEGVLQLRAARGVAPWRWENEVGPRFSLDPGRPNVRVAIDGEPVALDAPLEIESLPGALRLLTP